ncbi:MAG: T9SS type A sorting domain-containing protein [Bacteroidota bacterium]|nr:T9SS type A sorting domain-containing protein [Bacteroidota bacterium]
MKRIYSLLIAFILFSSATFATGHIVTPTVIQNVTCNGGSDGKAYVTVSGGVGLFTYSWNSTPVQTTDTLFNVVAGTYTCTVTDQNDMSVSTATVTINSAPPISVNVVPNNVSCAGMCNGSGFATATGGQGTLTYLWQPFGITSQNAFGLCPGTYTVFVTDSVGCSGTATTTIIEAPPIIVSINSTNVSCSGGSDGSATAVATGGTPGYTYNWSPSGGTTSSLNGISAGAFTVTVTDAMGCTATATTLVSQPTPVTASITVTNPTSCGACDGTAQVNMTGGVTPYSYTWNQGSTTQNINNLCPGVYQFTGVDANGCTVTTQATITNSGTLVMNTTATPDTCGQSLGTAIVTGAQGPVTYLWQPGNYTTQSIANVPAGNYFVTVTDTTCSYSASVAVSNYGAPNVVATSNAASCGNANGLLVVSASAGTPPYQFSINGSSFSTNTTYNNLTAGNYTIVCNDANGCQSTITQTIQSTGMFVYFSTTNATCNLSNGTSFVNATGGNSPYTFLWNDGSTAQMQSNLAPGTYTCTVTDNVGCVAVGNTTINTQATIYLNYDYDYYNCGVNSLTATANFGQAPYTYAWTPNVGNGSTVSNLTPGNYVCTVTDANGCTGTGNYWIGNNSYSLVSGAVFADLNSNCIFDSGEENVIPLYISATNASNQQVGWGYISNQNNTYQMYLPQTAGTYTISLNNYYYYSYTNVTFNCSNNVITLTGNCDTLQNLNLGYTPVIGQDLHVSSYCGVARPGFSRYNYISYYNPGTVTVAATVKMQLDNLLTYNGSTPPPTSITGNLFEWNLGNLAHGQSGSINVYSTVPTIQNGGALGTVLHDSVWIEPMIGDNYVSDNTSACASTIVGSYDPNMKEVYADNMDAAGGIDTTDTDLYYTVYFQNTGTDTAFTIVVNDTISDLLEMNTLEVLAASHPYTVSIQPNKVLQVRFNNILLVDSNRNEVLSHGYFHYKIRTKSNLTFGQQIENTADIYFDFNPPVITNTVVTPIQAPVGIKNNKAQLNAVVYPNPANSGSFKIQLNDASYKQLHFTLYNVAGMKVIDKQLTSQPTNEISTAGLTSGIYFYQLMNADGKKISGKIVISN